MVNLRNKFGIKIFSDKIAIDGGNDAGSESSGGFEIPFTTMSTIRTAAEVDFYFGDYRNSNFEHSLKERRDNLRDFMNEFVKYLDNEIHIIFKKNKNINIGYAIVESMM